MAELALESGIEQPVEFGAHLMRLPPYDPLEHLDLENASFLIVDDEPTNARVLIEALKDLGQCHHVNSGERALTWLQSNTPDLIFLDISMPEMDGYDVCRLLKGDPLTRDIPIIFVTGATDFENEERSLAAGAADFMTKPFWPPIVRARTRHHLMLRRAVTSLQRLATRDPLTQAVNRRFFGAAGDYLVGILGRYDQPFSIVVADIDHFKSVNDTYGHGIGDSVLKEVAGAFQRVLRRVDLLGRLGGEEFGVLLPQTAIAGGTVVAEKLRASVEAVSVATDAGPVTVTASFGVTEARPGEDLEQIVQRADKGLYRAKSAGRNRVMAAPAR